MSWLPGLLLPGLCPHSKSLQTHASTGDPQTLIGRSGSVSCGGPCSFPGVLVHTGFVCAIRESLIGVGLILMLLHPSYHIVAASPLSLDVGYLFFFVGSNILLLMVV